jgi:hypothetical protein
MAGKPQKKAAKEGRNKRQLLSKHPFNFAAWISFERLPLIGFTICLLLGVLMLVLYFVVPVKPGDEVGGSIAGVAGVALTVAAVAFLGWLVWRFVSCPAFVRVYSDGLVWKHLGRETECGWEEVSEVYRSEQIYKGWHTGEMKLVFTDGGQVKFNNFLHKYDQLADSIQQVQTERLLPECKTILKEGSAVAFGPIEVGPDDVTLDEDSFAWDKLKKVALINGYLVFRGGKREREIKLSDVPNYALLFALLAEKGKRPVAQRFREE